MSTPLVDGVSYFLDGTDWRAPGRSSHSSVVDRSYDWSDSNLPWAYSDESVFTEDWPANAEIVDLATGAGSFWGDLSNTLNFTGGRRIVVRLPAGVHHLTSFRMAGASGSPNYAFGFFFPSLRGFLGAGPDKTFVQMDANSMSQAQLDQMATFASADFAPTQLSMCRFDGSAASPVLLAGLTFRAADQQMLTSVGPGVPSVVPQPAPHNGVQIYGGSHARVSYVRFQAAGRAITSSPPFETANIQTGRGTTYWDHCEFDGRRSPDLDSVRPRRCGPVMLNGEDFSQFEDCWFHHSNVSRYAANDENREVSGIYNVIRCKADQITNNQNRDPALNGGNSLQGYTNATPFGWESSSGRVTMTDCIVSQDNDSASGQWPAHLQFTHVGSRNPQGGRLFVTGTEFRNTGWPWLDQYATLRVQTTTFWWTDGFDNTMDVRHKNGQRLTPHLITGSWPPSAASLAIAGVSPETHYLIRRA